MRDGRMLRMHSSCAACSFRSLALLEKPNLLWCMQCSAASIAGCVRHYPADLCVKSVQILVVHASMHSRCFLFVTVVHRRQKHRTDAGWSECRPTSGIVVCSCCAVHRTKSAMHAYPKLVVGSGAWIAVNPSTSATGHPCCEAGSSILNVSKSMTPGRCTDANIVQHG